MVLSNDIHSDDSNVAKPQIMPTAVIHKMGELIKYELGQWERLKSLALDSVTSPHSKRAYESALNHFLAWYHSEPRPPISKAVVNAYKPHLEEARLSASTINVRLAAVRRLVSEAADNGLIPADLAAGIAKGKGASRPVARTGDWLDRRQAERLINAPDTATLAGKRDRALVSFL